LAGWRLLDRQGKIVATAPLEEGRQEVTLKVPTDPARVNLLRVRVRSDTGKAGSFRVFCPTGKLPRFLPPSAVPDVVSPGDLALGRHWHTLETFGSAIPFRWVVYSQRGTV
jgi:hypothetical protein